MKKIITRLGATLTALALVTTAAFAITPQELGTILKERYVDEIPAQVWQETTVEGMLSALGDRYARYVSPQDKESFISNAQGDKAPANTFVVEDGHVGVLTLHSFGPDTYAQVSAFLTANDATVDRWIVDLRANQGGAFDATVKTMGAFTGGGDLAYLRDASDKVLVGRTQDKMLTIDPVLVLVGENTTSAAELFAATMRDNKAGLVIGSNTFGKGTSQTLLTKNEYPDIFADDSALYLTTYRFFSAGLNSTQSIGVIPHLLVADDHVMAAARLLCQTPPVGNADGYLRINFSGWRWYLNLTQAKQPANLAAAQAILQALPPQASIYRGAGDNWTKILLPTAQALFNVTSRNFTDVDASPYADQINALGIYGIISGSGDGTFKPTDQLTRASLCALLAQAMSYPTTPHHAPFADTPAEEWYTPYVATLATMGIVNGYDDGLFHPDDAINHQQFMAILARIAAQVNQITYDNAKSGPTAETDMTPYASFTWAAADVWLLDGLWHDDVAKIDPNAPTTREEAAASLHNLLSALTILPPN